MKTVKQLAEETFGKTKDGKGLVTLDDAIKFAEMTVEQNKFKWSEIKTAPLKKRLLGLVTGRGRKFITQIAYCPNASEWYGELGLEDIEITHWMPLPELPEIDK